MSESVSPHGFATVRGRVRGYRPEQVDRHVGALSASRDEAWERAARLTVLVREMEGEARRLTEQAAALPPQTYEALGPRAQELLATAEAEAAEVRAGAEAAVHEVRQEAEEGVRGVMDAARAYATRVRSEAEAWAEQCTVAAQGVADETRVVVRREAKECRAEAVAALREARQRSAAVLADQEKQQAEQWDAAGRELVEREAALEARLAERVERAEAGLAQAQQRYAEVEQGVHFAQEAAAAQAAEVVVQAREWEERVVHETERTLREDAARREEVCRHLDRVRGSLASLSARLGERDGADDGVRAKGGERDADAARGQGADGDPGAVPGPAQSTED